MWQWQNHLLSCLRSAWPLQAFSFTTWVNVVLCFGGYLYYQTFWVHIHTNPFFLVAWLQPKQWINFHYNSVLSLGTKTQPWSQMIFASNIYPGSHLLSFARLFANAAHLNQIWVLPAQVKQLAIGISDYLVRMMISYCVMLNLLFGGFPVCQLAPMHIL